MRKIILSMVLIGMLVLVGCQIECPDCVIPEQEECEICKTCEVCKEVPEDKALISTLFGGWGENIDNNNEILFDFVVYNYGNVEAKDVIVTCIIDDFSGKTLFTKKKNIGNIASTSENFEQVVFSKGNLNIYAGNIEGGCHVSTCNNCEILDYRIPELKERLI